jgi:hypothetical protein
MVDFLSHAEVPERLRAPFRAALRGEASVLPDPLAADERNAIVEHGLAPLLYERTRNEELRSLAVAAAVVEPFRLDDLRAILALLGVPALILKGTALAYDVYPAPELRPRSDTDLFVAQSDMPRVRAAMLAAGYVERLTSGDELGLRQALFSRADRFGVEHMYDVHWAIANRALFAETLQFEELLVRSIALPRIGGNARGLADTDALLLACLHRVAHHRDSERMIWLYDIHLLRERMSADEHAAFWKLAAERKVVAVCEHSIARAEEAAGNEPRHRAMEHIGRVPEDEPSRFFLDRDITRGALLQVELRSLPGWGARARRLRQLAFPPPSFMREQFPGRSGLLLPWLYAYRGLRGVARLFRRIA